MSGKTGFPYHLYLLLNFPRAAILDNMTSYGCPIVSHKRCSASFQPNVVTKSKMAVHGKFKSEIGDNLNWIFVLRVEVLFDKLTCTSIVNQFTHRVRAVRETSETLRKINSFSIFVSLLLTSFTVFIIA